MVQVAAHASLGMDRERCWGWGARGFLCGLILVLLELNAVPLHTSHGTVCLIAGCPIER